MGPHKGEAGSLCCETAGCQRRLRFHRFCNGRRRRRRFHGVPTRRGGGFNGVPTTGNRRGGRGSMPSRAHVRPASRVSMRDARIGLRLRLRCPPALPGSAHRRPAAARVRAGAPRDARACKSLKRPSSLPLAEPTGAVAPPATGAVSTPARRPIIGGYWRYWRLFKGRLLTPL